VNQVTYIYDLGRNYQTNNFILRYIGPLFSSIGYGIASAIQSGNGVLGSLLYYSNPYYFTNPIQLNYINLHDVGEYGENFATFMSFVLLWIGAQTTVLVMYTYSLDPKEQFNMDMALLERIHGRSPPNSLTPPSPNSALLIHSIALTH